MKNKEQEKILNKKFYQGYKEIMLDTYKKKTLEHEKYFTHRHGYCSLTQDDILFFKWWGFSFGVLNGITITLMIINII